MERIYSEIATSISELKANPMDVIRRAEGEPVVVLNRNTPAFYCIAPELYESMLEALDDMALRHLVEKRVGEKEIKVKLGDL